MTMAKPVYASSATNELSLEEIVTAAKAGNAEAQYILGDHFYEKEDYKNALKWFRAANRQGSLLALEALADMYKDGKGLKKNQAFAFKLYQDLLLQGGVGGGKHLEELLGGSTITPAKTGSEKGKCFISFADNTEAIVVIRVIRPGLKPARRPTKPRHRQP